MEGNLLDCYPNCVLRKGVKSLNLSSEGEFRIMGLVNQSLGEGTCGGYDPAKPNTCNNSRAYSVNCLEEGAEALKLSEDILGAASKEINMFRQGRAIISAMMGRDVTREL